MNIIQLEQINKTYGERTIFHNLHLDIRKGEFLGIQGESGTGKSTLLNIIGLLEECSGTITIAGKKILHRYGKKAQLLLRHEIGYLFQNFALIDDQTVLKNLYLAMPRLPKAQKKQMCLEALANVGLDDILDKMIYQLSGGEQQRVAVARLILHKSEIILADEPTGSLDRENADQIILLLEKLHQQGRTIIMVSHDPDAFRHCTRIVKIVNQSLCDKSDFIS